MNDVRLRAGSIVLIVVCSFLVIRAAGLNPATKVLFPDASVDDGLSPGKAPAALVLAGGCFWGMEEVFEHVRGVLDVVSGYAGGSARNAKYELVSTGTTGHAESVKITYDPAKISYGILLKVFFSVAHDPTQTDGQGPDIGPQYRSVIFYSNERQQQLARAYIRQLTDAKIFRHAVTTEVVPLEMFYAAEAYHQDYARHHPFDRYILLVDKPKVDDLQKQYAELYVPAPQAAHAAK